MKVEQFRWTTAGWEPGPPGGLGDEAHLLLVFGGTSLLKLKQPFDEIRRAYPRAHVFGCSTAGEICDTRVFDDSIVVTAIHFEHTRIQGNVVSIKDFENSYQAGVRL